MNRIYGPGFGLIHNKTKDNIKVFCMSKRLFKVAYEKTKIGEWDFPLHLFIQPFLVHGYYCYGYSPSSNNFIIIRDSLRISINKLGEVIID